MKMSPAQNNLGTQITRYTLDPWVVMLCLGALGHQRHIALLQSFSFFQVFLANAALQFAMPILFVRDIAVIPSVKKEDV